jgi:ankyrin repeat domain-containing protein 13
MGEERVIMDQNNNESTELHYLVFNNKIPEIKRYIEQNKNKYLDKLSIQDKHGNTPLHLACMFGRFDIVKRLVNANAKVKIRNKQMWTPLNEAISYGNRDISKYYIIDLLLILFFFFFAVKIVLDKFEKEVDSIVEDAKPKIIQALNEMIDFYVEIKWDFESWIPLVSRFLPSDVCKLYKKGTKIRIDCTLGDIVATKGGGGDKNSSTNGPPQPAKSTTTPFNWHRGDLTFLFDIDSIGKKSSIVFMDNKRKIFANIEKDLNEQHDLEREMDLYLSKEMIFLKLNTKNANFQPIQVGWFSKRDKYEQINNYMCQFYDVNNLFIVSKIRNEHMTDDEIKKLEEKQKKMKKSLNSGGQMKDYEKVSAGENANGDEEDLEDDIDDFLNVEHKPSLTPPPDSHVSWNDYIEAPIGDWPNIGRQMRIKESRKEFKAQLAVVSIFLNLLNFFYY